MRVAAGERVVPHVRQDKLAQERIGLAHEFHLFLFDLAVIGVAGGDGAKFGFPEEICYQSIGHHEDKPKTLEGIIVKAADAISGARPGARKDSLESYVKRLEDLEQAAMSFEGVEKVYAIQAGREIRVFVNPKHIDDFGAVKLARDIANKIEAELRFPGEIRVTLIRETRIIEYAK